MSCNTDSLYEVYADKHLIYSGTDWVASILACRDAGRVHGAERVERWVDGHLFARLVTTREPVVAKK